MKRIVVGKEKAVKGIADGRNKAIVAVTNRIVNTGVYQLIADAQKQALQNIVNKALAIMNDIQAAAPPPRA